MSELANGSIAESSSAISEHSDVAVTQIAARRDGRETLRDLARSIFGADLPLTPRVVQAGERMIVWAGPDHWLIIDKRSGDADPSAQLAKALHGVASVLDVSDSRTIFRLHKAHPSDALVRSMAIDFEDNAFKPGDVAITQVAHLGLMVWRLPDGSGYEFACARTYARDFFHWLGKA
ncbi:MAG: sarcosine oxidase subunit gamma family protein [Hyphomicrobium sp.]|uniref:sarcosine oxidase subunit gamma n=1 Tax=Hyphomicrobium sp. TaxID=82 RepID=UPI0039E21A67